MAKPKTYIVVGSNDGKFTVSFGKRIVEFADFSEAVDHANSFETLVKFEPHLLDKLDRLGRGSTKKKVDLYYEQHKEDPEFMEKRRATAREYWRNYYSKNKEKIKAKNIRHREARQARENAEKQSNLQEVADDVLRARYNAIVSKRRSQWCNVKGQKHDWFLVKKKGKTMFGLDLYQCRRCGQRDLRKAEK
jgi:predicted nucleotidyltransferase component of viral defense system